MATPSKVSRRAVESGVTLPPGMRTVADGLDHPECVCWCPSAECLYAGGEHGQIYRVSRDGTVALVTQFAGGFILGLAVDGDGIVYACDIGNRCIHRIRPDGKAARYGPVIAYPNYPAFSADGRLYVTDSGVWTSDDGAILCIEPGGRATRLQTPPLMFPNGLAVHEKWLYVVESTLPGVSRVPLAGGERETVLVLDRAIPDGIAFDAHGGLWIGCWQPNLILRLAPEGDLRIVADDWSGIEILTPNNLAFSGPDLSELAFPALGGNFIRAFRPGARGRPLHYPKVRP